ncbi:MAG: hypothetical protein ACU83V_07015, partial [Gammaproteobacteria bacterium]
SAEAEVFFLPFSSERRINSGVFFFRVQPAKLSVVLQSGTRILLLNPNDRERSVMHFERPPRANLSSDSCLRQPETR